MFKNFLGENNENVKDSEKIREIDPNDWKFYF